MLCALFQEPRTKRQEPRTKIDKPKTKNEERRTVNNNVVIRVENLYKEYRLGTISHGTLYKDIQSWWARMRGKEDPNSIISTVQPSTFNASDNPHFLALKDVSFEVKRGEVLGIIGRNGAGKSTLLKILSEVTSPTKGTVKIKGRVASLLEVGTGFHPELTGRENIYLNGAILGMTKKEIDKKFDEIVAFAEIEKFIDTPVKRYSSGMYVRLAFAVAAHLEPEILIIDEVLAVGDAQFQKKCLGKMGEVSREGRTVLFVSHQMDMIRALCGRTAVLDKGMIAAYGETGEVIDNYLKTFASAKERHSFEVHVDTNMPIQFISGRVVGQDGKARSHFDVFDTIIFEFEYAVNKEMEGLLLSFELRRNGSTLFISFDTDSYPDRLEGRKCGIYNSRINIPTPLLKSGRYTLTLRTGIINQQNYQTLEEILCFNVDLISRPSTFLSYAERRIGLLALPLNWEIENTSEVEKVIW